LTDQVEFGFATFTLCQNFKPFFALRVMVFGFHCASMPERIGPTWVPLSRILGARRRNRERSLATLKPDLAFLSAK